MAEDMTEFLNACREEPSKAAVLRRLGYNPRSPGNYRTLERLALENGIPLPDGSGIGLSIMSVARPLDEILVVDSDYRGTDNLKKRLLRNGLLEERCYRLDCPIQQPEWLGIPIVFQLDHINGINTDNRIENLRLLCPNCHSQTETFCRRKPS